MVARHDQHDRVAIKRERGGGDSGRGIASLRFQDQQRIPNADLGELLLDHLGMRGIGDDHGCGEMLAGRHAVRRKLKHRLGRGEAQQLLRPTRARQRPQPGARAAGKNDGGDLGHPRLDWRVWDWLVKVRLSLE